MGGKSVVSLFSNQSGKTNHSAPLGGLSKSLGDSPLIGDQKAKQSDIKKQ